MPNRLVPEAAPERLRITESEMDRLIEVMQLHIDEHNYSTVFWALAQVLRADVKYIKEDTTEENGSKEVMIRRRSSIAGCLEIWASTVDPH